MMLSLLLFSFGCNANASQSFPLDRSRGRACYLVCIELHY